MCDLRHRLPESALCNFREEPTVTGKAPEAIHPAHTISDESTATKGEASHFLSEIQGIRTVISSDSYLLQQYISYAVRYAV